LPNQEAPQHFERIESLEKMTKFNEEPYQDIVEDPCQNTFSGNNTNIKKPPELNMDLIGQPPTQWTPFNQPISPFQTLTASRQIVETPKPSQPDDSPFYSKVPSPLQLPTNYMNMANTPTLLNSLLGVINMDNQPVNN
jgi:hypothetical protein